MATHTAERAAGGSNAATTDPHLLLDDRVWLLRAMLLMRGIEERAMTLYRQGKVPGSFYDGYGQEAVSAGAAFAMAPEDRLCVLHRDLAAHLIRGVTPARVLAQYLGRATGITRGRDGNVHFGDPRVGCVGMVSMLPDMMLVATGMAMAFKLRGEARCAMTWFGDGSTSRGDFHEAMNWAGVQKLPVIFVLENNQYAYSTPLDKQFAVDPVERAAAYGFVGQTVDGNDAEAMFEATRAARERALGSTLTYLQAISSALCDELRADERVLVMGEDIGVFGGAFKVTDGFIDEFGPDRVMDTPLAESGIIGTAIGAAVVGMRPVCEMQFSDFISCGFDQLVNVAGKMHYRQGLAVPITVRLPSGGGFSGGPFHSQNPEAWFMHAPGIKVVAPSTASDAKGLLHAAIRDPNPVCFMEHKHLYRRVRGEVPEGVFETPFTARVAREGSDMVVIAYGAMVGVALEATSDLDGASVEVLDLRSLVPLDTDAILGSVRKTSKVVILHEATRSCGVGAEVAALIAENAFEDLGGPIVRVTAPDVPIPFSPPLERAVLPQVDNVKEACRELLPY